MGSSQTKRQSSFSRKPKPVLPRFNRSRQPSISSNLSLNQYQNENRKETKNVVNVYLKEKPIYKEQGTVASYQEKE